MSSSNAALKAGTPILINAEPRRFIPFTPPAPGREYPPLRDNPFKHNAKGFVETQVKYYSDVCPPHLWRVHGELYDFEPYLDTHPGGRIFLEQTRGTDCTEAFESHHIRGVNKTLLEKHRVSFPMQAKPDFPDRYSFEHFQEIKQFVRNYLEKELKNATGKTPTWAGVMYLLIVLQFLGMARLAAKRQSYFLAGVAGVLLSGCWGVGHNEVHRGRKSSKWNWLRYAMDLTGFSSYETTVTHAISHHLNTNLSHDIEVYNLQDVSLYFLPNEAKPSHPIYRTGIFALSSSIISPFLYLSRVINRIVEGRPFCEDVIIPTALLAMMCKESGSVSKGLKLGFFMWGVFSAWFVPMSFCVHHSMDDKTGAPLCYHEGEPEDMQKDFAAHEIVASLDFAANLNDYIACTFFAHLNIHTIHHIFPTIDRTLHKPILDALLKENPGRFREFYNLRNKVNKNFWTELYPGVFKFIRSRRFEIVNQ